MPQGRAATAIDRHVGARLRLRRFEAGWSQERLADHLGVSFQQIQKYERGTNRVSASVLFALSQALNVSVDYFFGGLDSERGQEDTDEANLVVDFVCSQDGPAIALAFSKVECRAVREQIIELVRVLGWKDG